MDTLSAMKAFARVAETHSFSATARDLRLSKSLISRQISSLENELGVRLFNRTTRSLALTEAGQDYFERVTRILSDIEEAQATVTHLQTTPRGKLRISAPMSFSILHLSSALPDFLEQYPDIEIDITINDRFVDLIEEGFDIGIRIGRLTDSTMKVHKLASLKRIVCASPAYLARYGSPRTPDDLKHHNCLCYSNMTSREEWRFITAEGLASSVEVKGRLQANNGDVLRVAALKGMGIAYLPSFMIGADLQAAALVSLLTESTPQDAGIYAIFPPSRQVSTKVRAFIDFLSTRFGHCPYWDLGY